MSIIEIAKLVKEVGLGIAGFVVCAYLGISLVKFLVIKITASLDGLVSRMEVFCTNVRREHKEHYEQHQALMKQHDEMIKTLGRINGYSDE